MEDWEGGGGGGGPEIILLAAGMRVRERQSESYFWYLYYVNLRSFNFPGGGGGVDPKQQTPVELCIACLFPGSQGRRSFKKYRILLQIYNCCGF